MRITATYRKPAMNVDAEGEFAKAIKRAIKAFRPQGIVETGTFMGNGTTKAISEGIAAIEGYTPTFDTIEVNTYHHAIAKQSALAYAPTFHLGLSIPRSQLPTDDQIKEHLAGNPDTVWVDHSEDVRAEQYKWEVQGNQPDDLLGKVTKHYDVDFALLDSAGHIGLIEFKYLLSLVSHQCVIALDDTNHVKHWKTVEYAKSLPGAHILDSGDEKFGWHILLVNSPRQPRVGWRDWYLSRAT